MYQSLVNAIVTKKKKVTIEKKDKMKKVNWVIDKYIFEDYETKLADAIVRSGMNVHYYDELKTDIGTFMGKRFTDNDIVIFHGSLQHGRRVEKLPLYPGIFLTLDAYECYKYYGHFGDYLLNNVYRMLGLNDVLRYKQHIFAGFGTDSIFIRPSNGYKSFPGQTLPYKNFEQEFDILTKSYGGLEMDTLVVVSPAREIDEEYRFIVVDGKVVSGSLYMDKHNRSKWEAYYNRGCEDKEAWAFAEKMAKIYQPDKAFTLDVCKLPNGEYKLIEVNSFCCGSMYGNDYDKVVEAVNKLCISEFEDIWGEAHN